MIADKAGGVKPENSVDVVYRHSRWQCAPRRPIFISPYKRHTKSVNMFLFIPKVESIIDVRMDSSNAISVASAHAF